VGSLNIAAWVLADLIFDAPFALVGAWFWGRRRRKRALRLRIAPYSHLSFNRGG
jgi:hypothetical protein